MRKPYKPMRLIYVDDSGAEQTGFACFSWVSVLATDWAEALQDILDWRAGLRDRHQIPKHFEIHSTEFVGGRGRPSTNEQWNLHKRNRSQVFEESFDTFSSWSWLTHGTVYSVSAHRRARYQAERARVYSRMVANLDEMLTAKNELGILIMDGDGQDSSYLRGHRELPIETRSLLEDPSFQNSSGNQWVQLADMLAYCAYQSLIKVPNKEFSWHWYSKLDGRLHSRVDVSQL